MQPIPEDDLQECIHYQGIERIEDLHVNFFDNLIQFKEQLQAESSTNLKYLLCRLDFNDFYQNREEEKKNFGKGDDDDMEQWSNDNDEDDDGEEDEDEEEDEEDEDEDEEDEDDGDEGDD